MHQKIYNSSPQFGNTVIPPSNQASRRRYTKAITIKFIALPGKLSKGKAGTHLCLIYVLATADSKDIAAWDGDQLEREARVQQVR